MDPGRPRAVCRLEPHHLGARLLSSVQCTHFLAATRRRSDTSVPAPKEVPPTGLEREQFAATGYKCHPEVRVRAVSD